MFPSRYVLGVYSKEIVLVLLTPSILHKIYYQITTRISRVNPTDEISVGPGLSSVFWGLLGVEQRPAISAIVHSNGQYEERLPIRRDMVTLYTYIGK